MICIHCGKEFSPNPRVKNQRYCGDRKCQTARRASWYRKKIATDPDYRDNQKRCQKEWLNSHPGYWKDYREKHAEYVERNRLLQLRRNAKRRRDSVSMLLVSLFKISIDKITW